MKYRILLLCVLVACSSAAPLTSGNSSTSVSIPCPTVPQDHIEDASDTAKSAEIPTPTTVPVDVPAIPTKEPWHPDGPRIVSIPRVKVTFGDWFSRKSWEWSTQSFLVCVPEWCSKSLIGITEVCYPLAELSLWIQIPLAVMIFFMIMILLVILLNIIFFWCAFCCACGLACFIPDDYVRIWFSQAR